MANEKQQESTSKKVEQESVIVREVLCFLQQSELLHLELEFENYKASYPTTELPSGVH